MIEFNDNNDHRPAANMEEDDTSVDGGGGAGHTNPTTSRAKAALAEQENLARTETRVVVRLRVYLFVFLSVAAALLGWITFTYTRQVQDDDFTTRFASIAGAVSDSFHDAVERKLGALDALSVSMTSHAVSAGETFPTVALPDFDVRGANTRINADGVYVFWLPLVHDHQRAEWEAYAQQRYIHLFQSFGTEMVWRDLQDRSFGYGQQEQQQTAASSEGGNQRRRTTEMVDVEAHLSSLSSSTSSLPRNLQAGPFQTFIPTIWNFQVRSFCGVHCESYPLQV